MTPLLFISGSILCGVTIPEVFYDALYYHLVLPHQYFLRGELVAMPGVLHSAFPAYLGLFFGALYEIGGTTLPKLFVGLCYIALVIPLFAFARQEFSDYGKTLPLLASFALLSAPAFALMATMTALAIPLTLLALLYVQALSQALRASPEALNRWFFLAAIIGGLMAGTKYTGLYLPVAGALTFCLWRKDILKTRVVLTVQHLLLVLLIASPWYVRNWINFKNPFHPALSHWFGENPAALQATANLAKDIAHHEFTPEGLLSLLQNLFWTYDGLGSGAEIGHLFALLALLALFGALRNSQLRPWFGLCGFYLLLWACFAQNTRFIYPILGVLALLGVRELLSLGANRQPIQIVAFIIVGGFSLYNYTNFLGFANAYYNRSVSAMDTVLGQVSSDEYLRKNLRYYEGAQWAKKNLSPDAQLLLIGETRVFYFSHKIQFSSAWDLNESYQWLKESKDTAAFVQRLKREGITHLFINHHELQRLSATYDYFPMSDSVREKLRPIMTSCELVFDKAGIQICSLKSL